jgi:alkanesulfonate monooxygenase SsuD/methylene tetrahydromethanopterin reductase-like flavin-dependent oxidoreductase (luciferase family)
MIDPSFYVPLAQAVEEAGYDGMVIPDSICYPQESSATYPYNPDGTREFLEDKPFLEPFALIPALGAVTSKLRFTTFVVKLPIRHPVLVAKQATSVAVLTGNRLVLGVGTSPWPEDYEATGVPWEGRGKRMDEAMEIVAGLSAGGWFDYDGDVYKVPRIKITPVPTEQIPLLVGGHAEPGLLDRLGELRREYGREKEPFEIHVISMDAWNPDGVHRLEDQGISDVIVGFRWPYVREQDTESLQDKVDNLRRFADDVIAKV